MNKIKKIVETFSKKHNLKEFTGSIKSPNCEEDIVYISDDHKLYVRYESFRPKDNKEKTCHRIYVMVDSVAACDFSSSYDPTKKEDEKTFTFGTAMNSQGSRFMTEIFELYEAEE